MGFAPREHMQGTFTRRRNQVIGEMSAHLDAVGFVLETIVFGGTGILQLVR
jgi:hypothetical protein